MTGTTPAPIPTDHDGLYAYLAGVPSSSYQQVEQQLAAQLGGDHAAQDQAARAIDAAYQQIEYEATIDQWRTALARAINSAADGVNDAQRALAELTSDTVYDVEYAEGGQVVRDLQAYLDQAGRLIRAARAVNRHQNGS